MKAVILAAGLGSRIRGATHGAPKSLLRFGGRAILDCQLASLARAGVREIGLVVGYRADEIKRAVETNPVRDQVDISFIENERYASTNNMFSLAIAQHWLDGEAFICLNADVLCHPGLPALLLDPGDDGLVLVDPEYREETAKVLIRGGVVVGLGKRIPRGQASGTFVNIASFSAVFARALFEESRRQFARNRYDQFFNDVLNDVISGGATLRPVDSGGLPWAEIDDENDLRYARETVAPAVLRSLFNQEELEVVA